MSAIISSSLYAFIEKKSGAKAVPSTGAPDLTLPNVTYTLTMNKDAAGHIYFSWANNDPQMTGDFTPDEQKYLRIPFYGNDGKIAPLSMRVVKPCTLTIKLGDGMNWTFVSSPLKFKGRTGDSGISAPQKRYTRWTRTDTSLTFEAPFLTGTGGKKVKNRDHANYYIQIDQPDFDPATLPPNTLPPGTNLKVSPLILILDPDIKNPGNDPDVHNTL